IKKKKDTRRQKKRKWGRNKGNETNRMKVKKHRKGVKDARRNDNKAASAVITYRQKYACQLSDDMERRIKKKNK
ncbi:hypothetical protein, partial [Methylobacterium radiotolerans]|uniref:hypothetical protein n=1 Tax=Methylobacterium radiotolerans TaxID=31998 RepID=UPI001AECC264